MMRLLLSCANGAILGSVIYGMMSALLALGYITLPPTLLFSSSLLVGVVGSFASYSFYYRPPPSPAVSTISHSTHIVLRPPSVIDPLYGIPASQVQLGGSSLHSSGIAEPTLSEDDAPPHFTEPFYPFTSSHTLNTLCAAGFVVPLLEGRGTNKYVPLEELAPLRSLKKIRAVTPAFDRIIKAHREKLQSSHPGKYFFIPIEHRERMILELSVPPSQRSTKHRAQSLS